MSTEDRATKYRQSMIRKYGSREAWLAQVKVNSSKGGKKKVPKGWVARKLNKQRGLPVRTLDK